MNVAVIACLDDVAARAVPAAEVCEIDGWRAGSFPRLETKRANSVLPSRHERGDDLEGKLAAVECFYAQRARPARFQITPAAQPSALEPVLLARGYLRGFCSPGAACAAHPPPYRPASW